MSATRQQSARAATSPQRSIDPYDEQAIVARLSHVLPSVEVAVHLPMLRAIQELKRERSAVVVAHNYQVPLVSAGVADFVGDSLAMAQYAARCQAPLIIVCGVRFMAETVKLLCPAQQVLLPNLQAGCSLADSIDEAGVRELRVRHPGVPLIAYVNTTAAVKAQADICCTSANAVAVVRSLGVPRVLMVPDRNLAQYAAEQTGIEVIANGGQCDVHVRYSGLDIAAFRQQSGAAVLAHPECTRDVRQAADFVGSTGAMAAFLAERRPRRALLLTECSMADNVMLDHPEIEFLKPCNLCTYMKTITLPSVQRALEERCHEIHIAPEVAAAARRAVERMLAL